jgi:hypothetical protein
MVSGNYTITCYAFQGEQDCNETKGEKMTDKQQLDQTYHFIMETFVATGRAPHFTEIANKFSLRPDEGKKLLHDLMNTKLPIWLYPGTDLIASFAPFNNLPTQYRLTIDGHQKWFAQ